jgi:hypothetical protein
MDETTFVRFTVGSKCSGFEIRLPSLGGLLWSNLGDISIQISGCSRHRGRLYVVTPARRG